MRGAWRFPTLLYRTMGAQAYRNLSCFLAASNSLSGLRGSAVSEMPCRAFVEADSLEGARGRRRRPILAGHRHRGYTPRRNGSLTSRLSTLGLTAWGARQLLGRRRGQEGLGEVARDGGES